LSASLFWLSEDPTWGEKYQAASSANTPAWELMVGLANHQLDMLRTNRLDKLLRRAFAEPPIALRFKPIRLALLSSSTLDHLPPAIRVAGLRRNLWIDVYAGDYGQYQQELIDTQSALHRAAPDEVLFAFDHAHLFGGANPGMSSSDALALIDSTADRIAGLWQLSKERLGAHVIQQTVLPTAPPLLGTNEHRLAGSQANLIARMNERLRMMTASEGVDLLSLDEVISQVGLNQIYDPALWYRAKQEVSPSAAPLYGDLVARLLAARRGLSFKCLVLDLDNTLWGGVIGDDGLEGIKLGQGSALGEAFLGFQRYCKDLAQRGVILAVCSKNDDVNARAPFESHPEMILRSKDISCFVANWDDKAANIRRVAEALNIGLDALVFADDNAFERNIVRRELPMVAVPELPEDPALYASCIAGAGYFESVQITESDLSRTSQYQANIERERDRKSATDMAGYLKSLNMRLLHAPFDSIGLSRIVQLINKTNQFNLTTRRYDDRAVRTLMEDPTALTLQLRLVDKLGDNGMISVIIGCLDIDQNLRIDTWLMSCRVLGREVEQATLNVLRAQAVRLGAGRLIGEYIPTPKNGMVREHYRKLGFDLLREGADGASQWVLELSSLQERATFIEIVPGESNG